MAKWQPPIPAGALYSKQARTLGPALPLLAYCYDLVQRDGWCEIVLKDAASDMDEPYQNVKRWWAAIRLGPFFCETIDRGRSGWKVKFKTDWIDWRILSARPTMDTFSSTTEVPEKILETPKQLNGDAQVHFKYISSTNEVPKKILENNVYGTQDTDQAEIAERAAGAPAPALQKAEPPPRAPEHQAYLDRKKAIEIAYVTELGYTPADFGKEAKASKWLAEQGYTPEQVVKCYRHLQTDEFYARQHVSLAVVSKQIGAWVKLKGANGHSNGRAIPPPTRINRPPDAMSSQQTASNLSALLAARGADRDTS